MLAPISLSDIQKQVTTLQVAERFFDAVVLFALFEVGVFRALAPGPRTLDDLHGEIGGDLESLRAALDAAVALKIISRRGSAYTADEALRACLGDVRSPAYLGEWVEFLHALAGPLFQLGAAIRTGQRPGALFEDMSGDRAPARRMTRAMDAYARTRGVEMADRLDLSGVRRLLDLGCGPGTYSLALLDRHPQLHATLLDLPGPIAEARRLVDVRGLSDRVEFIAQDAMTYEAESAFDAILVSNMLHMLGPEGSMQLLKRCHQMLAPAGRIIVQAQFLDDSRTSPRWATLLNLIQRVATPHGRNHAVGETIEWLHQAGFRDIRHVHFAVWNVNSCLVGRRPLGG